MIVAFFESLKHTGHLFPISFLRIFLGYFYLHSALSKIQGEYLKQPQIAALVNDSLSSGEMFTWYQTFLESVVVPYWQVFAYLLTLSEIFIGIAFILGFLVRPFVIVAIIMGLNLMIVGGPDSVIMQKTFLAINITLGWIGAGRCLGFDYFFYKRNRGIWW